MERPYIAFLTVFYALSMIACDNNIDTPATPEKSDYSLRVSPKTVNVNFVESVVEVAVTTDIAYEVKISTAAGKWISVAETRAELRNEVLAITVAANHSSIPRSGTIELCDSSGEVLTKVQIIQKGRTPASIHSIYELNGRSTGINSHADDWQYSSLEFDYSSLYFLCHEDALSKNAPNSRYPRVKRLANGKYFLMYQQGAPAHNIFYALSDDFAEWRNCEMIFDKTDMLRYDGVTNDRVLYSSADAVVLSDGTILAFSSFRLYRGYREESLNNGIMMRRSTDNGLTWGEKKVIFRGWNWEPYALELSSGEIHVYFTRSNPIKGDSGTSLLRSFDKGETWIDVGFVARQRSPEAAIDGSGDAVYTDQMPVARELNCGRGIALSLESRIGSGDNKVYHLSFAYSHDNWATPICVGYNESTSTHLSNFVLKSGSPYLVQFPSGETVMSFNTSGRFTLCMGDADAKINTADRMIIFPGGGSWGSLELDNSHVLLAAFPDAYTKPNDETKYAKLQMGRLVLNHRINASTTTPTIDGHNVDWEDVQEALFIGSETSTQSAFRFACDAKNLYCLVERLDSHIDATDTFELMLQSGDATGNPLCLKFTPDMEKSTVVCDNAEVECCATLVANASEASKSGYVVEIAIPRSLLTIVNGRILFNAVINEGGTADTFFGLTRTNYSKWLPVVAAVQ